MEVNILNLDNYFRDAQHYEIPEPICPVLYTLPYTMDDGLDDDIDNTADYAGSSMMRQPPYSVARILSLYEAQVPQSFAELERYRLPRFLIRRLFRMVIGYILRNVNVAEPLPQPVNQYGRTLLNRFLSTRPMFLNLFTLFMVPPNTARNILLNLAVFTLNNLTTMGGGASLEPAVKRVVDMIASSTNVFNTLSAYRISETEARALTASIARYVLSNPPPAGPVPVEQKAQQVTDRIIRNTDIYRTLIMRGVPASQARRIINIIVTAALREI